MRKASTSQARSDRGRGQARTNSGGTLEIRVRRHGENSVAIEFLDDGPGISEKILPRLFQPFVTDKDGGTGLGLALSHRVVEEHGGRLEASNLPGGGARFFMTLPIKET